MAGCVCSDCGLYGICIPDGGGSLGLGVANKDGSGSEREPAPGN